MTSSTGRPRARWRRNAAGRAPRRAAFTLIELLMVVVLSVLTLSLAIPAFSHASRSNRLRTAARTMVAAHRYARGMAVLRQADMVLLLEERSGRVQVARLEAASGQDADAAAAGPYGGREAEFFLGLREPTTVVPTNAVSAELDRYLPEGVRMARIEVDEMQRHEYTRWVDYQPNGMCDPFEVELADDRGRRIVIRVTGVTGRAEVLEGG